MNGKQLETEPNQKKTAAFLANLQRTVGNAPTKPAEPAPQPQPAQTPRVSEHVAEEPEAKSEPKPARKPVKKSTSRSADESESVSMEINLNPGKGQRVVYIRVDKTLADRLQLIAFQNKIHGGDTGPTTVNEIGIEALRAWLDKNDRLAA